MSQVLYLAAGVAGLPVFAASAALPQGAARLLGPTGGYLMAYPFAAFVTGWLASRGFDRRYLTAVLAMVAGLRGGLHRRRSVARAAFAGGISAALRAGLYPFVHCGPVKVCLAASVLPALWRLTGLGRAPDAGRPSTRKYWNGRNVSFRSSASPRLSLPRSRSPRPPVRR